MIKFRPALGMSVAVVLSTIVLLGLGQWQLQRMHWKNNLIAQLDAAKVLPAMDLGDTKITADMAWKKISLSGKYLTQFPLSRIYGISDGVPGFRYLNIFETDEGRLFFVVRGFVPQGLESDVLPPPDMSLKLTGLLRPVGEENWLTPQADIIKGIWYRRDLASMAAIINLNKEYETRFTLDLTVSDNDTAWPKPVGTPPQPMNNHLDYALTWFGMALVLLVIYFVWHVKNGRLVFSRKQK